MHRHRQPTQPWVIAASCWNIALALGLLIVLMAPLFDW